MKNYKIFILDHRSIYLNSLGDSLAQMGNSIFFQSSWNFIEIEAGIRFFKPDILITIGCDIPLHTPEMSTLPEICEKYNLFHIYWATEDRIHHSDWSLPFVFKIRPDLVWTLHPDCVESYQSHGFHADVLNFAFNPRMFPAKANPLEEKYNIALIATTHLHKRTFRYDSFEQLLIPLVKQGIQTEIWGFGWKQDQSVMKENFDTTIPAHWLHGYLPYKKTARIYHQSKIVLGIQNALDQISQRTLEILGSGSFMIASRTPVLQRMFTEGEEIVLSGSQEETLSHVQYYMERPDLRFSIGQRARKKIVDHYTYIHQLVDIWPYLEQFVDSKKKSEVWL